MKVRASTVVLVALLAGSAIAELERAAAQDKRVLSQRAQDVLRRADIAQNAATVLNTVNLTPRAPRTVDAAFVAGKPDDVDPVDDNAGVYSIQPSGSQLVGPTGSPYLGVRFTARAGSRDTDFR